MCCRTSRQLVSTPMPHRCSGQHAALRSLAQKSPARNLLEHFGSRDLGCGNYLAQNTNLSQYSIENDTMMLISACVILTHLPYQNTTSTETTREEVQETKRIEEEQRKQRELWRI
eukprot:c9172_g1_i5.p1 GENE.c9172_g1_i5~~c9172_g1_i5.p1  ORF type:complete len:129 (-),score=14.40 c9172_g1_i5:1672-2016(-)